MLTEPGLRPFGVSFLFAGHDPHHEFQLYASDPSGNYSGWKATCIGANSSTAQTLLRQDFRDDIGLDEAMGLALKVLSKTMDSTSLDSEKRALRPLRLCTADDREQSSLPRSRSTPTRASPTSTSFHRARSMRCWRRRDSRRSPMSRPFRREPCPMQSVTSHTLHPLLCSPRCLDPSCIGRHLRLDQNRLLRPLHSRRCLDGDVRIQACSIGCPAGLGSERLEQGWNGVLSLAFSRSRPLAAVRVPLVEAAPARSRAPAPSLAGHPFNAGQRKSALSAVPLSVAMEPPLAAGATAAPARAPARASAPPANGRPPPGPHHAFPAGISFQRTDRYPSVLAIPAPVRQPRSRRRVLTQTGNNVSPCPTQSSSRLPSRAAPAAAQRRRV